MSVDAASYGYIPPIQAQAPILSQESQGAAVYEGLGSSCLHCRRRKVKCDKKTPCANCVRLGFQCELAPRKRAPRRPRKDGGNDSQSAREVELLRRLNTLESR